MAKKRSGPNAKGATTHGASATRQVNGFRVDARLLDHKVIGPMLREALKGERPSPGYIRGLAAPEPDPGIRRALLDLARNVQERFGAHGSYS